MPLSANPAARAALVYITVGSLMDVWGTIWYWYMRTLPDGNRDSSWWYVCIGVILSGVVLILIGLLTGRIGHEARHADAPPAPPAESQRTAEAMAAGANAATAANVAGNAPTAGAPMYVMATPVGAPVAGIPAVSASALPAAIPTAPVARPQKV